MSRTQTRYDCDTGYADGMIDLSASEFISTGGAILTRNGKGDVSWNQGVGISDQYTCPLSGEMFRSGLQDDLQERFGGGGPGRTPFGADGGRVGTPTTTSTASVLGGGNGVPVTIPVQYSGLFNAPSTVTIDAGPLQEVQIVTAIPTANSITVGQLMFNHTTPFTITDGAWTTPASVSGPPPFRGVTQLVPPPARPKGIGLRGVQVRFLSSVVNMSTLTIGLSQTVFRNGVALAVTDILAPAALPLAFAATLQVVPVAINTGYLISDVTEYNLEVIATTAATGTFRFYGATLYVFYNFN